MLAAVVGRVTVGPVGMNSDKDTQRLGFSSSSCYYYEQG
jgi:hypothetical protein